MFMSGVYVSGPAAVAAPAAGAGAAADPNPAPSLGPGPNPAPSKFTLYLEKLVNWKLNYKLSTYLLAHLIVVKNQYLIF